ncbi:DUF370 domain-containing protein [Clostridia bacterium]|nr:DUF370 domain-containing protein [Clostridia bacterium]
MFLHIGDNVGIWGKTLIGIFDLDGCTTSRHTKQFLWKLSEAGNVQNKTPRDLPESFVLTSFQGKETVHISNVRSTTIASRTNLI